MWSLSLTPKMRCLWTIYTGEMFYPGTSDPPLRTDSFAPYLGNGHCSFWAYPQGPTLQPICEGDGC